MALNCQETRPSFDRALMQDITYLIFVQPKLAHNVTGRLQLTVRNRKLPPNGQCRNATTIDPTLETFLPIRASNFAIESPSILLDTVCGIIPKFWYKITNPLTTPISVDITLHSSMYTRRSYISVVRASNCSTLQCVGGVVEIGSSSYNFVTEQLSSYYIIVNNGSRKPFNITIKGRTSFFSLIDAEQDKALEILNGINYHRGISTSPANLNIQAHFALPSASGFVKSVRLTHNNNLKKVTICDQKAPYSVFGDVNGDFNNKTIPLGHHRITATPYAQSNCTGRAGTTMVQDFVVSGCFTQYIVLYNTEGQRVYMVPFTANQGYFQHTKGAVMLSLPCSVELLVVAGCGFPIRSLQTEFRNATTNELILSKIETPVNGSSYHSFNFLNGVHVPVGSYSIRQIINDVTHPTMNFTVVKTNCK